MTMILQVPSVNEDWSNDSESRLAWLSTFLILPLRFGMYKICDITRRNTCSLVVQLSTSVKTISINSMPYNFHLKCMECPPLYISQCWIYRSPFWRGIIYLKTGWSILGFISRMFDCYCLSSLDNTKWDRLCYYCKTTRGVLNLCGGASPSSCPCKKDDP